MVTILCVAATPVISMYYSNYPPVLLGALLITTAFRPLCESLQVVPLTVLRLAFRNRTIAFIDGSIQLGAVIATIVLAILGAGAWSMTIPLLISFAVRAIAYQRAAGGQSDPATTYETSDPGKHARRIVRTRFIATGSGQYLHSLIDTLPILLLGKLASDRETGLFSFAFSLAAQANVIVASQIAGVLQPVLGALAHDSRRQTLGYLRAMRLLGAIAVPICLCQAAFSESLFRVFMRDEWQAAGPVFAGLSISEAFFFASAPTMAMLRAQGRFGAFLCWQGSHLLAVILCLPFATKLGGALGTALAVAGLWSISLPAAVWITTRPGGGTLRDSIRVFLSPWLTALPLAAAAWAISRHLIPQSQVHQLVTLIVGGPSLLTLMLIATYLFQPDIAIELRSIWNRMRARFRHAASP
jgi:O-antigen/teichoic acid export membrane protein